jgi:hypothetical protein
MRRGDGNSLPRAQWRPGVQAQRSILVSAGGARTNGAKRAFDAMMEMRKIDIAAEAARRG